LKRLLTAAVVLSLALAGATVADAAKTKTTHVSIKGWVIRTSDGKLSSIPPHGVFTHCSNTTVESINAKGRVSDAKVGDTYDVSWAQNGSHIVTFHDQWARKNGKVHFLLTNTDSNVHDAKYCFVVLRKGTTIGKSSMTLRSSSAVC
jgi:opacity protein-like surface antigen